MLALALLLCIFAIVRGDDPTCKEFPTPVDLGTPLPPFLVDMFQTLDEFFEEAIDMHGIAGCAFSLRYRGEQLFATGKGYADVNKRIPFTPQTKTRVASISKLFGAILLNQHASLEIMEMHDPIKKWCPSFSVPDMSSGTWKDAGEDITFFHLASHLSGLQRETPVASTTTDVLNQLRTSPLMLPPGSVPAYSNLGYALLGNALADCVNKNTTFAKLVDTMIVQQLDLKNTGVTYTPEVMETLAKGYIGTQEQPFLDLGWVDPSGGMYSSVEDLTIVGDAIIADAARDIAPSPSARTLGIKPIIAREFLQPVTRNPDGQSYIGAPWEMTVYDPESIKLDNPFDGFLGKETPKSSYLRQRTQKLHESSTLDQKKRFKPFMKLDPTSTNHQDSPFAIQELVAMLKAREGTKSHGLSSLLDYKEEGGPSPGGPYVVRAKGGSLPGYMSIVLVVPELHLSLSAVFNGPIAPDRIFELLMPYIILHFEYALYPIVYASPIQERIGPNPQLYTGQYSLAITGGKIYITYTEHDGHEALVLEFMDGGIHVAFYIVHVAETSPIGSLYRVYIPPSLNSCMMNELMALSGQYVRFQKNASGAVISVEIPGFAPGAVYAKV